MTETQPARFSTRLCIGVLVATYLALYGPNLVGFAPAGGDIVNQYLPYQQIIRDAIRQGHAPLWNSMTFCGRPLMADIQVGVLYPPNWLHWILPLPVSFGLVLALHGAWMMLGCWLLGRHWRLAPAAAALGTVLYSAAPFFTLKLTQGIILFIYVGAWWPWLALLTSRLIGRPSLGAMALLALALAGSLLAGSPQLTYYGWLMCLVLGFGLAVMNPNPGGNESATNAAPGAVGRLSWLACSFVIALGLTAIQTFQTYFFIDASFERESGASWEYVTDGSLLPRLLWLLINPGFLGIGHTEFEVYWGSRLDFAEAAFYAPLWVKALLLPPAFMLFTRMKNRAAGNAPGIEDNTWRLHRRLAWLAILAMVLGLLLALGGHSPLFRLFYEFWPGFNRFRVPSRLMTFFFAGEALLAALVLNRLIGGGAASSVRGRWWIPVGAGFALVLVWGLFLMRRDLFWAVEYNPIYIRSRGQGTGIMPYRDWSAHNLWLGLRITLGVAAAGSLLWALCGGRGRSGMAGRRELWAAAVPAVAAVELVLLAFPFQKLTHATRYAQTYYTETELTRALKETHRDGRALWLDDVVDWRVDQNQPEVYPNRMVMHGLPEARGYDPVNARWIGAWFNLLAGSPVEQPPGGFMLIGDVTRPAWLTLMGVESVISYQDLSQVTGLEFERRFPFPGAMTLGLWRNERFRGMAFAAPGPRVPNSPNLQGWTAELIVSYRAAKDPATDPLAAIAIHPASLGPGPPLAQAVDERFRVTPQSEPSAPNRFAYEVDYPQPALLCLSQSAYGGWGVKIDGRHAPLGRLSGVFLAAAIPAGRHEVVFEFIPQGLVLGRWVSLFTVVLLLYGLARQWISRPPRVKGPRQGTDKAEQNKSPETSA